MLCISGANFCSTKSYIHLNDNDILHSQDSLTILGFSFGNRPNFDSHIALIKRKYASRAWIPRRLKMLGVNDEQILSVYAAAVRSSIEYASPAFHTLLSGEQEEEIEKMQRATLKSIFGHNLPYRDALKKANISKLSVRREEAFKKFAMKAAENRRVAEAWFPLRPQGVYDLRRRGSYAIERARTERLKLSPIFQMRKLLNDQLLKNGLPD